MRIRYKRSGGIANIIKRAEFDSSELPESLQIFLNTLSSFSVERPLQSDEFFHELEFEDGRIFRCTDSQCPPHVLDFFARVALLP
jgi:hypothetical protein